MSTPLHRRSEYRRFRAHMLRVLPPVCHLCGGHVDKRLSGRHPMGPTLDHLEPRAVAPHRTLDPTNVALAHLRCNQVRGISTPTRRTTRTW